jgi:ABC-2 type transport system ATP-binding protein
VDALTHVHFRWITLRFREQVSIGDLANVPGVSELESDGHTAKMRMTGDFDPLLRAISSYYVEDLRVQEPSLEEIFLTYYGNNTPAVNHRKLETAREEVKS